MGNLVFSETDRRPHAEERVVRRGAFDMRLLINRPHHYLRLMDYRSGNYDDKRELLDTVAQQEGLRKIFTVVEKQDSKNWRSAGFIREAVYPSFFRTADAYMMSRIYGEEGFPAAKQPLKPSSDEMTSFPGRKLKKPVGLAVEAVRSSRDLDALIEKDKGQLRAIPFSRAGAPDMAFRGKARGKREVCVCAEVNDSFAHGVISFATPPGDERALVLCAYTGKALLDALLERQVKNVFAATPYSDRWANELMSGLAFQITGRLADHLHTGSGQSNALLWHLRLEQPEARS